MTDEQERRAVAWLDAHPAYERAVTQAVWSDEGTWLLTTEVRAALVAFLTSPLPCAKCGGIQSRCEDCGYESKERVVGRDGETVFHDGCEFGRGFGIWRNCPDCMDGTAGILLDQLERGSDGR